jgi:hypothetical protein
LLAQWTISKASLARWRRLVDRNRNKPLPRQRYELNVLRRGLDLSPARVWYVLVGCQVTTQQRSGPDSAVGRFLDSPSPALRLAACRKATNVRRMLERELAQAGLRRAPTIAANLSAILASLEGGEWKALIARLETLRHRPTREKERAVVHYLLGGTYPGLGQKQSRNFIQWLGLSRHEVPLDSRVLKRMRELDAGFVPSGSALTDEAVYLFVQDGLQQLAAALDIAPCMLDACIFASFEPGEGDDAIENP